MEKRSYNTKRDKSDIIEVEKIQVKPKKVSVSVKTDIKQKSIPKKVLIMLIYPVKYKYRSISGDTIVFDGAGTKQLVSRDDANILLSKVRIGGCCGSGSKRFHIFEEV